MTYEEAYEATISKDVALAYVAQHDVDNSKGGFLNEVGDKDEYSGQEVLDWLGY